ncbi:MAG: type II toxin-antitoxin system VapC family toxin [Elusimicrobia bacterium]|nr:type II toxin-antitoxin system VapC family toxin [Elusimicrobiota bacterium]
MQLVLDTNEFIFAYGHERKASCQALLGEIAARPRKYELKISRTIVEEVRRNIAPRSFGDFWDFLEALGVAVDEDWRIPFEMGARYEALRLKRGDAFVGAYAEWTGAQYLISENRHFLTLHHLPFRILRAEQFLARHA